MSTLSIEVEIVDGKVTPVAPHKLPATGRGVLTVLDEIDRAPFPPVEIVEGPDGYLIARGGRRITAEMVRAIQDRIDLEDAIRYQCADRPLVAEPRPS